MKGYERLRQLIIDGRIHVGDYIEVLIGGTRMDGIYDNPKKSLIGPNNSNIPLRDDDLVKALGLTPPEYERIVRRVEGGLN
ncbi:MAG: hypothetical protein COY38_00385 [Candidatus Aenigmarchaeota archaeon CG_4_10_14_0_8_um_filter_37_24]|nr:hypothetical protein [Candidatus Aenigmarchaeota archaeon]OIN88615.1 MAG: hypothetical protein AUJ50_00260 [Candidatus Aenigmarchaeota archaeon CG1_02_38_14]PIV68186.1 MAG: hypothetical protein COS07_04960 [Candidatus Aenigmarchaeota archaeon CG01_land_8_20_14_3_00_37_9]PIW41025.1 MAG: hypothetical protein COW21_04065 [Candidatus Aenigmarchaeota archaeon CG15_BIG_FIL_POST_REV_8_21_14_020_37_27]PIX50974.1 MAG: hypothetical protein COZ52_01395 [Candidatus Aenigmarchaeota archaeon CG_4_8_14_3_u